MWIPRSLNEIHSSEKKIVRKFVDNEFLQRYTKTIVISQIIGLVFIVGPFYFFALENYSIFINLADQLSPRMVGNILRERYHLNLGFITTVLVFGVFWTILSQKWIKRISGPIYLIQQHLHWLARGNYNKRPLQVRRDDEFNEVVSALNVMHGVIRQQTVDDLEKIEALLATNQSPHSHEVLEKLKQTKLALMNNGLNDNPDSTTAYDGRKLIGPATLPIRKGSTTREPAA